MREWLASSIDGCKGSEQRSGCNACIRADTAGRDKPAAGYGLAKQPEVFDQSGHGSMITKRIERKSPIASSLKRDIKKKVFTRSCVS